MKKLAFMSLTAVVLIVLLVVACAKPAPAPTPAPAPAPTPAPAPVPKITPMTLKTHDWAAKRPYSYGYEWWAEQVTKRTGGAIKFEHFYNQALIASAEQITGIRDGVFQAAACPPSLSPGKTPLGTVIDMPGLGDNPIGYNKAAKAIAELPELQAEWRQWNARYVFANVADPFNYIGKKPVAGVKDFRNLQVWGYGGWIQLVANLGAIPVSMPYAESFDALQRGVVQGAVLNTSSAGAISFGDISKYYTYDTHFGPTGNFFLINLDTWNKLAPEVQKIMLEAGDEAAVVIGQYMNEDKKRWEQKFKDQGLQFNKFTEVDWTEVGKAAKPVWDAWIKEHGPAAEKVFRTWSETIAKYEK